MRKEGYYSSGQFAKLADVSVRTIRFYDQKNLLKPSFVDEHGARFYTDRDLASLQQILLLKYLGFSLEEIRGMTIGGSDNTHLAGMLKVQETLVQDRIEQLQTVAEAIRDTRRELAGGSVNWQNMLDLIHLTGMERSLAAQYRNASNLSARIALHSLFSTNPEGWFPWLFRHLDLCPGENILEVGCGDGALWTQNLGRVPDGISVILSDISDGMIRDVRRNMSGARGGMFSFRVFDCSSIPYPDRTFDLVIANHVLFYADDLPETLREVRRVLKPGGRLVCSTYGKLHMHEIRDLAQRFDSHITLSGGQLYERFGLENGASVLKQVFPSVTRKEYRDSLRITDPQPLIDYILSCHGNQNQYLVNRYAEFYAFVKKEMKDCFPVTKNAGIFICTV